jgi:cholesterol oxidase
LSRGRRHETGGPLRLVTHPRSPVPEKTYDFAVIGSGFGGSVAALRLTQKGYRVLVLERGRRFADDEFAKTNWDLPRYLWLPAVGCHGIMEFSFLRHLLYLHGSGVGGGSLVYAGVLMEPEQKVFEAPEWSRLADWRTLLAPFYSEARRMLGVAPNPLLGPADDVLRRIAVDIAGAETFRPTEVGIYFGEAGETKADPYFGGQGPARSGCTFCGGCMVGCRYNSKNTLVKNYLHFAEAGGVRIQADTKVEAIWPLPEGESDGARYRLDLRRIRGRGGGHVRARSVVVSGGTLGTLELLLKCRDGLRSLPRLSPRLGERVRTNSESLLGSFARDTGTDYSKGIAISSIVHADAVTRVEPVRYPEGSSFIRLLSAPLVEVVGKSLLGRLGATVGAVLRRPLDFLREKVLPHWARQTTILLVMQSEENFLTMRWRRSLAGLFRRGLVTQRDTSRPVPTGLPIAHAVARRFAAETNGFAVGSWTETLLDMSLTAHLMGGCPMGRTEEEGVVQMNGEAFRYPGLYVLDGSIVPGNPGVNPSLTITALAEFALSQMPPSTGRWV